MRRQLYFDSIDDALAEVDRLARCECASAGSWDLAQVCDHLASAFEGSRVGIPFKAPWLACKLLGPVILARVLKTRRIAIRAPLPKRQSPVKGKDLSECVARFRREAEVYRAWTEPLAPHPFFDRVTREQWDRIHLIHMAHHLGFIVPT